MFLLHVECSISAGEQLEKLCKINLRLSCIKFILKKDEKRDKQAGKAKRGTHYLHAFLSIL